MRRRPISKFRRSATFDEWILVESVTNPEVADVGVPEVGISRSSSSRSAGCRTVRIGPAVTEVAVPDIFVFCFYVFLGIYEMLPRRTVFDLAFKIPARGDRSQAVCLDLYPMRFRACRVQA